MAWLQLLYPFLRLVFIAATLILVIACMTILFGLSFEVGCIASIVLGAIVIVLSAVRLSGMISEDEGENQ